MTVSESLVSILIPTFQRAAYLREAIASALRQSYTNIEVVILDDCSPDATPSVAKEFDIDVRVRYLRNERNLGIAGNWRVGFEHVRGEYFCILHDDDWLEEEFVARLLQPLRSDASLILSFCDQWVIDAYGHRQPEKSARASSGYRRDTLPEGRLEDFVSSVLIDNSVPAGAAMFRSQLVTSAFLNERARGSSDMWLLYNCVRSGAAAYFVKERLINYRQHDGGMTVSMPFEVIEGHIFRYTAYVSEPSLARYHEHFREQLAEAHEWLGMALLRSSRYQEAQASFGEAIKRRTSLKAVIGTLLGACGTCGRLSLAWTDEIRRVLCR